MEIRGGIKDGFALIDWFTTDNPQPRKKTAGKKTAELITDFLGALLEALEFSITMVKKKQLYDLYASKKPETQR